MNKRILITVVLSCCLIQCASSSREIFLENARQIDFHLSNHVDEFDERMECYFAENSKVPYGEQTCPSINRSLISIGDSLGFFKISDQGYLILNPFGQYGDLLKSVSKKYTNLSEYCNLILSSGDIPPQARAFIFESYSEFDFTDEEVQKIALIHLLFVCTSGDHAAVQKR